MINIEQGCNEQRDDRVFFYMNAHPQKMTVQSIKCSGVAIDSLSERFRQTDY